MSLEIVKEYLRPFGLAGRVQTFAVSSATVALAAAALGVEEARIAKTLSFIVGEQCVLVAMAGDTKVDNAKFKAVFGKKAKMPAFDEVENYTGHPAGGVCPFAVKAGVKVYLDEGLKRFKTVYPAAGTENSAVEVTCEELFVAAKAEGWVIVGR